MKSVAITGENSYIGKSFIEYIRDYPGEYFVTELNMRESRPTPERFEGVDVVFCVTGLAHIRESEKNRNLYFEVNRDLVVEIAKMARTAGVKQFILLSSMSVYGLSEGHITKDMVPEPTTAYGKSKLQADEEIKRLEDPDFIFTCLRPPMVYGKGCKGNYQVLRSFALKSPLFPNYNNERSMIYIGNLCSFVKKCIDCELGGLYFPQNEQYVNTKEMVQLIAKQHEKKILLTKVFNWAIRSSRIQIVKKAFGNLTYENCDTVEDYDFVESIYLSEV